MNRLAVFGNPVAHSRSPEIHEAFAAQAGITLSYERIEAPKDAFGRAVRRFVDAGARGFNVTVPFKHEAFELVDVVDDSARPSETVNTVRVDRGTLYGSNTDGAGLVTDVEVNLGWALNRQRILLIGAGGAVRGVLPALLARAPACVHLLNRTHQRAVLLARAFDVTAVTPDDVVAAYDIVISGSAAGLTGDDMSLPAAAIGPQTRCYDMIYAAGTTVFNRWAEAQGAAATSDGLGMLVEQAAAAFRTWFDFSPDASRVISHLRRHPGGS